MTWGLSTVRESAYPPTPGEYVLVYWRRMKKLADASPKLRPSLLELLGQVETWLHVNVPPEVAAGGKDAINAYLEGPGLKRPLFYAKAPLRRGLKLTGPVVALLVFGIMWWMRGRRRAV